MSDPRAPEKKSPFQRPASRAGIRDPRNATFISSLKDLEKDARPKQLSAHTSILRLEDLEEVAETPAAEPLGHAPAPPSTVQSKMVAFFGAKGGTGATTLALNTAGALAAFTRSAVVVDMDLQLGAVPVCLNIKPERSIAEIVVEAINSTGPVQSGLDRHASGLAMVAQGDRIEELAAVTTDRLPRFFDALGQSFRYVIVDGLGDFSDHAVASMDLAHQVVLVATQDVPAVRAAARSLRIFRRLGYGPERIKVVINRYHKKAPVTLEAIANALGQPVDAVVRNDFPLVEQALNHGMLVQDIKPSSGLARDIEALARLIGDLPSGRGGGGFLSRLFRRG